MVDTTRPNPSHYRREAETFVEIMRNMLPALRLDYSAASIGALERFIAQQFDPPGSKYVGDSLPVGVGCYVGETILRTLGGAWDPEGKPEINGIGSVKAIFPIDKAIKRFTNGPQDSLESYYKTVARYARSGESNDL